MLIGIDASRATVARRTGTEVYSLHLIRELLAIGQGHRFRLYLNDGPQEELFPDSERCEHRVIPFPRLWTHVRLSIEMLTRPPDVLFVPSHVLPIIHPRRSVVTVHDLGHRHYPAAHTRTQRWYLEWSTRYHVRTAAHLIADSKATKDDLVHLYDADPARITVAYLGVDPALRPVTDPDILAAVRQRYAFDGPYVLHIGTVQPRKNLSRLIDAFVAACREPGVPEGLQLVLAGKRGWLYEEILSRSRELGVEERVHFPGFVDPADLGALYSGAMLYCMPSLYEGFCMPVLEAMICRVPVVCSRVSSLPEVVGDAALTVDPHDVDELAQAIVRAVSDLALREDLVARGVEQAKKFTWRACAEKVLGVLEQV